MRITRFEQTSHSPDRREAPHARNVSASSKARPAHFQPTSIFFVDSLREQAADAVQRTDELRGLRREYEVEYGHEKTAADRLAMRLFQYPYVTANEVAEFLDVTTQTARNAITELESQDILEETTGKQRYQEFKAVDVFEILTCSFE